MSDNCFTLKNHRAAPVNGTAVDEEDDEDEDEVEGGCGTNEGVPEEGIAVVAMTTAAVVFGPHLTAGRVRNSSLSPWKDANGILAQETSLREKKNKKQSTNYQAAQLSSASETGQNTEDRKQSAEADQRQRTS